MLGPIRIGETKTVNPKTSRTFLGFGMIVMEGNLEKEIEMNFHEWLCQLFHGESRAVLRQRMLRERANEAEIQLVLWQKRYEQRAKDVAREGK